MMVRWIILLFFFGVSTSFSAPRRFHKESIFYLADGSFILAAYRSHNHSYALVRFHADGIIDESFGVQGAVFISAKSSRFEFSEERIDLSNIAVDPKSKNIYLAFDTIRDPTKLENFEGSQSSAITIVSVDRNGNWINHPRKFEFFRTEFFAGSVFLKFTAAGDLAAVVDGEEEIEIYRIPRKYLDSESPKYRRTILSKKAFGPLSELSIVPQVDVLPDNSIAIIYDADFATERDPKRRVIFDIQILEDGSQQIIGNETSILAASSSIFYDRKEKFFYILNSTPALETVLMLSKDKLRTLDMFFGSKRIPFSISNANSLAAIDAGLLIRNMTGFNINFTLVKTDSSDPVTFAPFVNLARSPCGNLYYLTDGRNAH